MIEVTEATVGIWQVALPDGNWFAHMARRSGGGFEILYRFRWYRDQKVFDSRDVKHWWRGTVSSVSEDECLSKMRAIVAELAQAGGLSSWELIRGTKPLDEFMAALLKMPGIHADTKRS